MTSTTTNNGSHTAYLSPLDQYMPRIYVTIYLIFDTPDPSAAVNTLQAGVKELGSRLPYLRGSISTPEDPRGRMAITWSSSDAPLSLHPTPTSLGTNPPPYQQLRAENAPLHYFANTFPALIQTRTAANPGSPGSPAFAASYTLLDSAVVLGIAAHHSLADGTGVLELIRVLAACTSHTPLPPSLSPLPDEPLHRHTLLHSALPSPKEEPPLSFSTRLASLPEFCILSSPEVTTSQANATDSSAPKGRAKLFTFSAARLETAREVLRAGEYHLDPAALSTNNILTAVIWACVSRARAARRGGGGGWAESGSGSGRSKMGFAINGRRQLKGEVSTRPYAGNVNLFGVPEFTSEMLEGIGAKCSATGGGAAALAQVVKSIWEAIRRVDAGHVADVVALMEQAGDFAGDVGPSWVRSNGPDLSVTSWANMDVYGCEFGEWLGRPVYMRVPDFVADGLVVVLPRDRTGREGKGEGIEVVVVLCADDVRFLEGDEVWGSWLV